MSVVFLTDSHTFSHVAQVFFASAGPFQQLALKNSESLLMLIIGITIVSCVKIEIFICDFS